MSDALKKVKTIIDSMTSLSVCQDLSVFTKDHVSHNHLLRKTAYQILYFLSPDVATNSVRKESIFDIAFAIIIQINYLAQEDPEILNLKVCHKEGEEISFMDHMKIFLKVSASIERF